LAKKILSALDSRTVCGQIIGDGGRRRTFRRTPLIDAVFPFLRFELYQKRRFTCQGSGVLGESIFCQRRAKNLPRLVAPALLALTSKTAFGTVWLRRKGEKSGGEPDGT
jgi:hypothetical protein